MSVSQEAKARPNNASRLSPQEHSELLESVKEYVNRIEAEKRRELVDVVRKQVAEQIRNEVTRFQSRDDRDHLAGYAALSDAVERMLDRITEKTGDDSEDVLLKALTLYELAFDATHHENQRLVLVTHDYDFVREIVGLGKENSEASNAENEAV